MVASSSATEPISPVKDDREGLLPPLLFVLTVVTGLVDAVSYLALGHVFVANMTGNVVFLGFAVAGAPDFSIPASLVAIASFLAGALGGGRLGLRMAQHRSRFLAIAILVKLGLVGGGYVGILGVRRDYRGRDAIRAWKRAADAKYKYVFEPLDASVGEKTVKLRARLTGNFPGSPVELDHTFTLANGKITSLDIR